MLTATSAFGGGLLVLKGPNSPEYRDALDGFRQAYSGGSVVDPVNKRDLANRLQAEPPDLIVAIGREAAEAAHERSSNTHLLFILVLDPARFGLTGKNIGGVSMDLPGDLQLKGILELLPDRKTVAIIHDPAHSANVINQAQSAAKALHLDLESVPVESPKEVRQRFILVKPVVDVVWVVPGEFVKSTPVWEFLQRESNLAKLPLIFTHGEKAVAAGALASMTPDYRDMGRQCGEMARQIMAGNLKVSDVGVKPPESVRWVVNRNTASQIGISIPQSILEKAKAYP